MKTTIERGAPVVTLINVFTVDPTNQEALVRVLDEATEKVIKDMPGFVSANIHRSLDGHHVVNYAQWESREAVDAMLAHPASQQHLRDAAALARFEPYLYEVTSVSTGSGRCAIGSASHRGSTCYQLLRAALPSSAMANPGQRSAPPKAIGSPTTRRKRSWASRRPASDLWRSANFSMQRRDR